MSVKIVACKIDTLTADEVRRN